LAFCPNGTVSGYGEDHPIVSVGYATVSIISAGLNLIANPQLLAVLPKRHPTICGHLANPSGDAGFPR
jgi:hypothetical protein